MALVQCGGGERANYERFKEAPGSKTYHVGEERDYIKREKDEKRMIVVEI